jgi:hypothetical protein
MTSLFFAMVFGLSALFSNISEKNSHSSVTIQSELTPGPGSGGDDDIILGGG